MSPDNKKIPRAENGDLTTSHAWLKAKDGYEGLEEAGYGDVKVERVDEIPTEEWNGMLDEEKRLRLQLKNFNYMGITMSPEDLAQAISDLGLKETLLDWSRTHKRNRAIMIAKGDSDIMISRSSQKLMKAAEILTQK